MTAELASFLGSMAGLALGVVIVQWLAGREAQRWAKLWVGSQMYQLTTEVRTPEPAELQTPITITCIVNNKGETL